MPPGKHLVRLLKQGVANRLGDPASASDRFEVPQQVRPTHLTPPHRIPVVGTIAIRHQNAGEGLAQQRAGHLATTGHPDQKDGHQAPSRQLVSSRCATRCASMESRASCTGSAITSVVVCSDWLIEPTLMGTPNRSAITCCVVRLDKRYDPLHSATVACTRGPYVPLGMPAGQGARVVSPQAGHTNWCHWYSVITGWMGGISIT